MKAQNKFQTTKFVPAPVVSPYTDGTNLYGNLKEKLAQQSAKNDPKQYGWFPGVSADKKATRKEIKALHEAARASNAPSQSAPKSLLTDEMLSSTAMLRGAPVGNATLAKASILGATHSVSKGIAAGAYFVVNAVKTGVVALASGIKSMVVGLASAIASGVSALIGFGTKVRIAVFGATKSEKQALLATQQKALAAAVAKKELDAVYAAELLPNLASDEFPAFDPVGSKLPMNENEPTKATKLSKAQYAARMDGSVSASKLNKIIADQLVAEAANVALPADAE